MFSHCFLIVFKQELFHVNNIVTFNTLLITSRSASILHSIVEFLNQRLFPALVLAHR